MAAPQPSVAIAPSRFERVRDSQKWIYARIAERDYVRRLRKVAEVVGTIVDGHSEDSIGDAPEIIEQLNRYAVLIRPWAQAVAGRMLADVARRDKKAWMDRARKMGRALREELSTDAPTGRVLRESLQRQVGLITSLPVEAAERVHSLTVEAQSSGARAGRIAEMISASGEVAKSRATLIARTEVSRTASELVQARARAIGSEGYIAIQMGRKFLGVELKESYWDQAVANLKVAHQDTMPLFAEEISA